MPRNRRRRHGLGLLIALPLAAIALSGVTAVAAEPSSPTLVLTPGQGPAGTSFVASASGFVGCTSGTVDGVSPETPESSPPPSPPPPITKLDPNARRPEASPSLTALKRLLVGAPGTVAFLWDGTALRSSLVNPADGTATASFEVPNP